MIKEQILSRLTAMCSRSEHCLSDVRRKMDLWGVGDEQLRREVCDYLVNERYIDEARYARFFINDKMKYNRWGKRKVEQALSMKQVPREVYAPLLTDIADDDCEAILLPLLRSKSKSVKASSPYEHRMKLVRFALSRGFSFDQASHCLDALGME